MMRTSHLPLLACLALLAASPARVAAQGATCTLEYERADNALASEGRPDGDLGVETLTMRPGQVQAFNTDWKFEKQRGTAQTRYGSHLRRARNTGQVPVTLVLGTAFKPGALAARSVGATGVSPGSVTLAAGETRTFRMDLKSVRCLQPPKTTSCTLEYERADNAFAAPGRPDGDLGKERITLRAGETRTFNTDWKYEKRKGVGHSRYGSHLRRATNVGGREVRMTIRAGLPGSEMTVSLPEGRSRNVRADLVSIFCP